MQENAAKVIDAVCDSDKLEYEDTYHVFLSCYSLYNRELDGTVQTSFITHCTNYIEIKGYTERITKEILDLLLKDLQHREEHVDNVMQGSGWTYIKTTSIDLTYSRVLGRRVQKITKKKRNSLANYVTYPTGRRGKHYIINPNPKMFPTRFDQHPGPENARCVTLAIKSHLMINSFQNENEKEEAIRYMRTRKKHSQYEERYVRAMNQQKVVFPPESVNSGYFYASKWKKLEKLNNIPIVVYHLEKSAQEKDVNLSCIYAPSQATLKKYENKPLCNLIQLSKSHVAYIPKIQGYFNQIFDQRLNGDETRYQFCYSKFTSKEDLSTHLQRGACLRNTSHPPRTRLIEKSYCQTLYVEKYYNP